MEEKKCYYENGQLREHRFYINSKLTGEYKEYYEDEQIHTHCFYINDNLNGEYKRYYPDGQLEMHGFCLDNKLNGECKNYDQNGRIKGHYYYINDKKYQLSFKLKQNLLRIKSYLKKKYRKKIEEEIYKSWYPRDISRLISEYVI